jgi:hypothetical protein
MQDVTLNEAGFTAEYRRALTHIKNNSKEILGKLQQTLNKDGDVAMVDVDEPLPSTVKMSIKKKM